MNKPHFYCLNIKRLCSESQRFRSFMTSYVKEIFHKLCKQGKTRISCK